MNLPSDRRAEWHFHLLGVPVRVEPWFWLVVLISAASRETGAALVWVAVCFVSILLHELGHVAAFRAFGIRAEALLYAWGGLAIPEEDVGSNSMRQVVVSLAGPFAGFGLAALVAALAHTAGATFQFGFQMYVVPYFYAVLVPTKYFLNHVQIYRFASLLVNDLLYVNFYWGLVNLLPVYPLDGGQATRALFLSADPVTGMRRSLLVSALVGAAVAVLGIFEQSTYLIFLFGILAASSAQLLESERRASPRRSYASWRDGTR